MKSRGSIQIRKVVGDCAVVNYIRMDRYRDKKKRLRKAHKKLNEAQYQLNKIESVCRRVLSEEETIVWSCAEVQKIRHSLVREILRIMGRKKEI